MQDHTGGPTGSGRVSRRGYRAATGIGAIGLLAAALTVGTLPVVAGAQVRPHALPKIVACEVTDTGGINDKSFNASAYAGLVQAVKAAPKGAITPKYESSVSSADYQPNINKCIALHAAIIVTVGFLMGNDTWTSAGAHSGQHFAIVDQTNADPNCFSGTCATKKNILGLTYQTNQDGFLGGYEAAATSKTHVVALYGGMQFSSVTIYMDGFVAGVRYYNLHRPKGAAKVNVLGWNPNTQTGSFVGSFTDQASAATLTNTFLNAKADRIFPVAGSDGLGTTSAVKTWNASHSTKALVEWVDTDGCVSDASECSLFLTSVTKGVTASVKAAVLSQYQGKYKGGNYVGTLKNGGVALATNTKFNKLPAAVAATVKSLTAGIESGKISVNPTKYPA